MSDLEGLSGNILLGQSITGFDPKRSFKASHSPTTEVLDSASQRLGSFVGGTLCGGASSSPLWARVSHGRSLRERSNRAGPIASVACLRTLAIFPLTDFFSTNYGALVS